MEFQPDRNEDSSIDTIICIIQINLSIICDFFVHLRISKFVEIHIQSF